MAGVMGDLDRLDAAIEKRIGIEDAFIQAMVAEFNDIARQLNACHRSLAAANQRVTEANAAHVNARSQLAAATGAASQGNSGDLAAANAALAQANADAAAARGEAAAATQKLGDISARLKAAAKRLDEGAPLNQTSLPKVINEVIGQTKYGPGTVPNGVRFSTDSRFGTSPPGSGGTDAPGGTNGAASGSGAPASGSGAPPGGPGGAPSGTNGAASGMLGRLSDGLRNVVRLPAGVADTHLEDDEIEDLLNDDGASGPAASGNGLAELAAETQRIPRGVRPAGVPRNAVPLVGMANPSGAAAPIGTAQMGFKLEDGKLVHDSDSTEGGWRTRRRRSKRTKRRKS